MATLNRESAASKSYIPWYLHIGSDEDIKRTLALPFLLIALILFLCRNSYLNPPREYIYLYLPISPFGRYLLKRLLIDVIGYNGRSIEQIQEIFGAPKLPFLVTSQCLHRNIRAKFGTLRTCPVLKNTIYRPWHRNFERDVSFGIFDRE